MKKFKWNWLDTIIVIFVVLVIVAACIIFLKPGSASQDTTDTTDFLLIMDTSKNPAGTYDVLKSGDEVWSVENNKIIGTIDKVEILPYKTAVFNETTKQYNVDENSDYPFCRITIKTTGQKNDSGEIYAEGMQILYGEEWFLETKDLRFNAAVSDIEGV